jgi:molybdopterin converting factor small subunit
LSKVTIRGASFFQEIMGAREIEMELREDSTVESILAELDVRFDRRLSKRLHNEDGSPSNLVRTFLNGRDIRFLDKKALNLSDGDIILLLPVLVGG